MLTRMVFWDIYMYVVMIEVIVSLYKEGEISVITSALLGF